MKCPSLWTGSQGGGVRQGRLERTANSFIRTRHPSIPTEEGAPVVEDAGDNADPVFVPTGSGSVSSGGYTGPAVLFWLEDASDRAI